jgi:hypothetical protein
MVGYAISRADLVCPDAGKPARRDRTSPRDTQSSSARKVSSSGVTGSKPWIW